MKNLLYSPVFLLFLFLFNSNTNAQSVGIGASSFPPDASSILEIKSDASPFKGLLVPRMTLAQRNSISSPATSLLIFQTDNTPGYYYNSGTPASPSWTQLSTTNGTVTSIATNNGITGGTITTSGTIGLTGQALALHNLATNGLIARTGAGTVAARTITWSGNGGSITNGDGVSGNPTVQLNIGTGTTQVAAGDHSHTNMVTGTGTANYLARWTSPSNIGIGIVQDNGSRIGIGTAPHGTYLVQSAGDFLLTSGWVRTTGSTGWYSESFGGGWYMTDATWIRSYGSKNIYHNSGIMRTDGTFQVDANGATLNVPSGGNFAYRTNVLFANTSGNVGIGTITPGSTLDIGGTSNAAYVQNLAAWGLNARTQGMIIMPEGSVTDNGSGSLTFGGTVIVMNPLSGSWIRVAAGTYALGSWGALWVAIPPTNTRGATVTPTVTAWNDSDRNYDGRDRILLAQRVGGGRIMTTFGTYANMIASDLPAGSGNYIQNKTFAEDQGQSANFYIWGSGYFGENNTPDRYLRIYSSLAQVIETTNDLYIGTTGASAIHLQPGRIGGSNSFVHIRNNAGTNWASFDGVNQRLGVGTSTPVSKLDVRGKATFTIDGVTECCGNDASIAIGENTESTGRTARISFHNSGVAEGSLELYNGSPRRLRIYDNQSEGMGLQMSGPLYVDGTGNSYIQGNVGIGTTSPGSKLTIAGTGSTPLFQLSNVTMSSVSGNDLVIRNLGQLRFSDGNDWDWNTWAGIKFVQSENKIVIGGPASGYFTANAAPPNVSVVFDGISNVGIGTTSPAEKLDVTGNIKTTSLAGTGNRPVYADANGVLKTSSGDNSLWVMSANLASSQDDLGGTVLSADNDDDKTYHVALPSGFTIEGTTYNYLAVCTNGWASFEINSGDVTNNYWTNYSLPSSSFTTPTVFAYWDDLVDYGSGEEVRSQTFGSSPHRTLVINYNMRANNSTVYRVKFQIEIHEGSNLINVKYHSMAPDYCGQSATIGFQLSGGSNAKAFPLTYNGKILDDNASNAEGWSICPLR